MPRKKKIEVTTQLPPDSVLENYKIVLHYLAHPPQTSSELYKFIQALTGERVVFKNVCEDHSTPWKFIWDSYKIDIEQHKDKASRNIIALGPRGGHKTLSAAKLVAAELLLKKDCEIVSMAAVANQAQRCFAYVRKYLQNPIILESGTIKSLLKETIELNNGSSYLQCVATISGVNSKHPQHLVVDEVELIKPEILTEARMMPASRGDNTAHMSFLSTRKFVDGVMENLVSESKKKEDEYELVTWCYKEASEPCPESRRGKEQKVYEIEDIYNPGESVVVNSFIGCGSCPLHISCKGALAQSTGTVPIDDTINEFLTLDRETWLAQKECRPPSRRNLFFSDWNNKVQVVEFEYNPTLITDLAFDFTNGADQTPTVCQFWQEDESGNTYLLAVREYYRKPSEFIGNDIKQFAKDLGIKNIRMQIGDSAQQQEIRNLNNLDSTFFRIVGCRKIMRKEGWPVCRKQIRDNTGRRRLYVNPRYAMPFIKEIENATRAKADPDDIAKQCVDHNLDAWRYREVKLRFQGYGGEPNIRLLEAPDMENKTAGDRNAMNRMIAQWESRLDD